MKGTEKQIKWAEEIKAAFISRCDGRINWEAEYRGNADTQTAILYRIMRAGAIKMFDSIDDAAKIIDKRHMFDPSEADDKVRQWGMMIERGKLTIDQIIMANKIENY